MVDTLTGISHAWWSEVRSKDTSLAPVLFLSLVGQAPLYLQIEHIELHLQSVSDVSFGLFTEGRGKEDPCCGVTEVQRSQCCPSCLAWMTVSWQVKQDDGWGSFLTGQ